MGETGRSLVLNSCHFSAAQYDYLPNSDLLLRTTSKNNGSPILTTTRTWDYGCRLRQISSTINNQPSPISSFTYVYDHLNRRIQASLEDGSAWNYDYNDRNELIGARRYCPDWSPAAGQQYAYNYDNIGNRTSASSGGDVAGGNLRTTSCSANSLNEYTSITTPGYASIIGAALPNNNVAVNSGFADRKGEYFHREISVGNSGGPLWQNVTVTCAGTTSNGCFAFPKNTQSLTNDLDGNLTFDGIWTYEWDAENRLSGMSMTNISNLDRSNRLRLDFGYDYMGRRVSKIEPYTPTRARTMPTIL